MLAVTNDIDTHVVYGLQYCNAPFLTKEERYEIATRAAIEEVCWHAGYAGFPIYKPLVWFLAMQPLFFIFALRPTWRTPKAKNFMRSWSNGRDVTVAYIC